MSKAQATKMNNNLWKNFKFTRFLAAWTISSIGDWFDIFALQLIFTREFNASPIIMGLLVFLYFIPAALFSPIAGIVADRYSKRNIMIATDILSAILTVALFFSQNILTALLLVLIRSTVYSFGIPAQRSYIKHVVVEEHLLQASSYEAISSQLAKILGPVLGAVVLIVAPARACLGINALSFIASFLLVLTLPIDKPVPYINTSNKIASFLDDIKNGGIFVWKHVFLRSAFILVFVWYLCGMIRTSQITIFLTRILPETPNMLGYVLGLEGLGAVIAGTILSRFKNIFNYSAYFIVAFFCIGCGVLGIACYQETLPLLYLYISSFALGIGSGIGGVTYNYLLRKESPKEQIGCVYGISSASQNLAQTIGALLSGVLVIQLGVREVYILLSCTMFILVLSTSLLLRSKY